MKNLTILLSVCLMFVLTLSINATTYTSTATGNWSTQVWSPVGTPGVLDDVVIADGHTVTIDQNISIANLIIGGGTSGILTFDATTGRTVTVSGNVTVSAGGSFLVFQALTPTGDVTAASNIITNVSSTAGIAALWNISGTGIPSTPSTTISSFTPNSITMSAAATISGTAVPLSIKPTLTDSMIIGGNLTNDGTFDMSLGSSTTVCNVKFNKVGDQTISGAGSTTRFRYVYLDKSAVGNKVICNINVSTASTNITFIAGTWEQTAGRLTATSGSMNIGSLAVTSAALRIIGSGSVQIASNLNVYGTLLVSTSDSLIVGTGTGKIDATYLGTAVATFTSGTVVVYGKIALASLTNTTINGANIIVDPKAFATTDYAFRITTGGGINPLTFTSGTVTILNGNSTASAFPELAMSSSIAPNISGTARFVLGQGAGTVGANGFRISLNSVSLLNHLTINTGSIGVTLQTNVIVKGTLTLISNGALNAGAFALKYQAATGTLAYNGTAVQTTSNFEFPTADAPTNLTINNGSGVILHAARTVPGMLTLTSGLLTLGTNNLTLGSSAVVSGGSNSSYVDVSSSGVFNQDIAADGSYAFPIGNGAYSPVQLALSGATYSSASVAVDVFNLKHPQNVSTTDYLNRYWKLTATGITLGSYNANFVYDDGDIAGTEASMMLGRFDGLQWSIAGTVNAGTNTLSGTGLTSFSDFTGGEGSALPIELSNFNCSSKGNFVQLTWKTTSEVNSSVFEVQRKSENTEWTKVGEVSAAGNSNSPKDYTFTDKNISVGKSLYRLKMIDADGRFEYSDVVESEISMPTEYAVSQNYPNPFNPTTRIDYQLPFDSKVTLELYGITGEKIATLINSELSAGYYTTDINASALNLVSGVYIYRMTANNQAGQNFIQVKKLMLTK